MDEAQKKTILDGIALANQGVKLFTAEFETGEFFVLRSPKAAERRIYQGLREQGKTFESEECLLDCVLYPAKAELKTYLEEQPFAIIQIENAVLWAGGARKDVQRKKL